MIAPVLGWKTCYFRTEITPVESASGLPNGSHALTSLFNLQLEYFDEHFTFSGRYKFVSQGCVIENYCEFIVKIVLSYRTIFEVFRKKMFCPLFFIVTHVFKTIIKN